MVPECKPEWNREAITVFFRLPSLMAADKSCPLLQPSFSMLFFAGTRLKKVITGLEESLDIKTKESEHLQSLVTKMEATPGQDEMNKVQITDLKGELAKSEETLKFRTEELLQVKKELRHWLLQFQLWHFSKVTGQFINTNIKKHYKYIR